MHWAAVALGSVLAACGPDVGHTQQPPSQVTITDLSDAEMPSFEGRLVIGPGLGVFGMISRGQDGADAGLILVEMLTSQTVAQMRRGSVKIDALSFVYQLDCTTMRYRLANQVNYDRNGQPLYRVNLNNAMIDGPMADYLQPACGRSPGSGIELGSEFSSMGDFLTRADTILAPRRAALPPMTVTVTPVPRQN